MKTNTKIQAINSSLGLLIILAIVFGCRGFKKNQTTQTQPIQISQELRTIGTITSANTGGTCAKNLNGQMLRSPQIGFSYSVGGTSYTSVGCTYNPQTAVGAKINVCYSSTSPTIAKPCGD